MRRRLDSTALLVPVFLLLAVLLRAGDTYVSMGSGGVLLGQPEVQLRVYTPDDPATPENELVIYHPDEGGDIIYNSFVLDTGANGLMIGKGRNEVSVLVPMEANGFVSDEAQYEELGVGGSSMYGVSGAYSMDFAGSDGVPLTMDGVRFMCDAEAELGYEGIVGMPAMVGRVVHLDMSLWEAAELGNVMQTLFVAAPPAEAEHRYTIPLHMTHFAQDGQQNPGDPLPTWAPLPFMDVVATRGVNEQPGNFLLDTGAQLSMVSHATAVALGLDTNGNGVIDVEEAHGTVEVGGVGGTREVPIVSVDSIRVPSTGGTDLVWKRFEVIVLDIAPGIDGIIGMDLLHSGWMGKALGDATAESGAIDHVYFDFRDIGDDVAEMVCYLHPDRDVVLNNDAPQVTVESESGELTKETTIPFLVTFDQMVTGFVSGDVTVTNGEVQSFEEVTPGRVYRVTVLGVAPDDDDWGWLFERSSSRGLLDTAFTVCLTVPALVAQNAAGSGNDRGEAQVTCDANAMTATLATTAPDPTTATPIPFTLSFDGTLLLFSQDAIVVENGTLSNFVQVVDPDDPFGGALGSGEFTFDVVPAGNGEVVVTLPTAVSDGLTSFSTYFGDEARVTFSGFPVPTLSSDTVSPTGASSVAVSVTFSRPVTGFAQDDLVLTNAKVTSFAEVQAGQVYDLAVAPLAAGQVVVVVPQGVAQDVENGLGSLAGAFGFESIAEPVIDRVGLTAFRLTMGDPVSDPLNPASYSFDPALEVLSVEEESPGVYLIHTTTQSMATDYTLTVNGEDTVGYEPDEFAVSFLGGDGGAVVIGQSPDAADGLGDGFDQEGDGGTGDQPTVRILNTTGEGDSDFLVCDVRQADGGVERWYLEVVFPTARRTPWSFSWELGGAEEGQMVLLQQLVDEAPCGPPIDMTTIGEIELDADAVFEVLSGPVEQIELSFQAGWNLVGTPLVTLSTARESATSDARQCMLAGDVVTRFVAGAYEACDASLPLLAESGYWVFAASAGTASPTEGLRDDGVVRLRAGWNLVTPTTTCTPAELDLGSATFWAWDPLALRYRLVEADDELLPGAGYWVHVAEARVIEFPGDVGR